MTPTLPWLCSANWAIQAGSDLKCLRRGFEPLYSQCHRHLYTYVWTQNWYVPCTPLRLTPGSKWIAVHLDFKLVRVCDLEDLTICYSLFLSAKRYLRTQISSSPPQGTLYQVILKPCTCKWRPCLKLSSDGVEPFFSTLLSLLGNYRWVAWTHSPTEYLEFATSSAR